MPTLPWEDIPKDQPRQRGRPVGSVAKSDEQKKIIQRSNDIYERVQFMLTTEEKVYVEQELTGRKNSEPITDMRLFAKLYKVYNMLCITDAIAEGKPKREVAENAKEYRQVLKDIFDMEQKMEDKKDKKKDERSVVDPTRESTLARFKGIH